MSGAEVANTEIELSSSSPTSYAQKYGYVPFGGGIRECLGKEFARLEMKIFAIALIRGYQWTLEDRQDLSLVTVPTPHPRDNLRVQFTKHVPSEWDENEKALVNDATMMRYSPKPSRFI